MLVAVQLLVGLVFVRFSAVLGTPHGGRLTAEKFWLVLISSGVGLEVSVAGIRVVLVVGEGIAVFYEVFDIIDRYCKTESAKEDIPHIGYTDDLSGEIKQWSSGVAGVDVGVCLEINKSFEGPVYGADDAVCDGSLKSEGITDCKDFFADFDAVDAAEISIGQLGIAEVLYFQHCQVNERVDGLDFDLFEFLFFKFIFLLLEDGDFDFCFFFDYVIICYEVSVFVDEESGAHTDGAGDFYDGFREAVDTFFYGCFLELGCSIQVAGFGRWWLRLVGVGLQRDDVETVGLEVELVKSQMGVVFVLEYFVLGDFEDFYTDIDEEAIFFFGDDVSGEGLSFF